MPELWQIEDAAKARAFGPPDALDGLRAPAGVRAGRVAGDEVLWVGAAGGAGALTEALRSQLGTLGNRAAVVDHSDGYALFALSGEGHRELFARLSSIRLPDGDGFAQGNFAGVPSRIFSTADRLEVLVASYVAWFVGDRLAHAGRGLVPEPAGDAA